MEKRQPSNASAQADATASPQEKSLFSRVTKPFRVWEQNQEVLSFKDLYLAEAAQLGDEVDRGSITILNGVGGEPWVAFTPKDRFGLALSGGGIRSATFNLGLMQALAHLGILQHVHYLSTVSGGGYIGGFWTAWLKRKGDKAGQSRFPLGNDQRGGERAEVRHLREFSRFLLPRLGITQTEFWGIAMTLLGGFLPSFIAAIAILFLCWSAWAGITALLILGTPAGVVAAGVAVGIYLAASEISWAISGKSEYNYKALLGYLGGSVIGILLVVAGAWVPRQRELTFGDKSFPLPLIDTYTSFFAPALLLVACTLVLLLARVVLARVLRGASFVSMLDGFERMAARFLGLSIFLTVMAFLWWGAGQMQSGLEIQLTAAGAALSATLFGWAKKWLMKPAQETHGSNLLKTILNHVKRATPKLLAGVTWLLLFVLVGAAMHGLGVDPGEIKFVFWQVLFAGGSVVALTALLFDPARVGMHEFYRSRIARCYLGASNFDQQEKMSEHERAAGNRHVIERPKDDLKLRELGGVRKPLHLICTAANDISGDAVGSLYRGARSAVLSARGISLGNMTAKLDDLRLSSALTASAAAFNSQMGRMSMDLGPAVTFLMSALNLRLGLWVPHPRNRFRGNYSFPGRFFLYELFGLSRTSANHLHLSDGAHFENFGLYELARRHVRYIIVSDCGADSEVAFDDLANVLRRIREDFGIEIDLDISPLRPGPDGLARQHAVVGTIHYNGLNGMDKGTILFFKPSITGDEPPDVLQYRTRNREFPHESTGDQFYDEAQWESYRRLGEHAGRMVLGFFEQPERKLTDNVDRLFRDARSRWHPAPKHQQENFLAMSERCAALEEHLLREGPKQLRTEFFSEVNELWEQRDTADPDSKEETQISGYLINVLQIMEDVWLGADLEHYWSHPLNEGWMNYFQRWASTPSFRRWWPILSAIYSPGFREFAKERFRVGVIDKTARPGSERSIIGGQLTLSRATDMEAFLRSRTWQCYKQRFPDADLNANATLLRYDLALLGYNGGPESRKLVVGFASVLEEAGENSTWVARWRADELFVPLAYTGSGIIARLLDGVIKYYENHSSGKFSSLRVEFSARGPDKRPSEKPKVMGLAARHERVREIEFYKSRGFGYTKPENPTTGEITLTLGLPRQ
jgi:hypothetical protein